MTRQSVARSGKGSEARWRGRTRRARPSDQSRNRNSAPPRCRLAGAVRPVRCQRGARLPQQSVIRACRLPPESAARKAPGRAPTPKEPEIMAKPVVSACHLSISPKLSFCPTVPGRWNPSFFNRYSPKTLRQPRSRGSRRLLSRSKVEGSEHFLSGRFFDFDPELASLRHG